MLIALEGPDGVGKTTLARLIAKERGWTLLDRKSFGRECGPFVERIGRGLSEVLWRSGDGRELSFEFWSHVQAAWYLGLSEQVMPAAERAGAPVVVDGWFYKFVARLMCQGVAKSDALAPFHRCRRPDFVVLLTAEPQVLWKRGRGFRPTELGLHAGYQELSASSFLDYQACIIQNLETMAVDESWNTLRVAEDEPAATTAHRIAAMCATKLGTIMDRKRTLIGEGEKQADRQGPEALSH